MNVRSSNRVRAERRIAGVVLLGLLAVYARTLLPFVDTYAAGGDAAGYLWSARLFRYAHVSMPIRVPLEFTVVFSPSLFAPLGATVTPGTWSLVPTYPPGLPLHIAFASMFMGEERAVRATLVVIMVATLWMLYRLGREAGLDRVWATAACALLALSPLFLLFAVQPMSDVLATFWAETAVFFAWRARRRRREALLAGVSLGVAVLVRPTNAVMMVPIVVAVLPDAGLLLRVFAASLPFLAALGSYQSTLYGSPLASGYGDVSTAFSWTFAGPRLLHYAQWIPRLTGCAAAAALGCYWAWRADHRRWALIATSWVGAVFGFYAFYYHTNETWWYLRFALPAFPAILIAAARTMQECVRRATRSLPARLTPIVAAAAALSLAALGAVSMLRLPESGAYQDAKAADRVYSDAIKWILLNNVDRHPVLMGQLSGAAQYYAPELQMIRFDRFTGDGWSALRAWQAKTGTTLEAALASFESQAFFANGHAALPCDWRPRGTFRWVTFWECPPGTGGKGRQDTQLR